MPFTDAKSSTLAVLIFKLNCGGSVGSGVGSGVGVAVGFAVAVLVVVVVVDEEDVLEVG